MTPVKILSSFSCGGAFYPAGVSRPFVTSTRPHTPLSAPSDEPDNRPPENIEEPDYSQAYDEGSIPFTRSSPLTDK